MNTRLSVAALCLAAATLVACGDSSENEPDAPVAGAAGAGGSGGSGNAGTAGSGTAGSGTAGSGGGTTAFVTPADPGPGGVLVTVSGEDLALSGYDYVQGQSKASDPAFVDGWSLKFTHVLLTVTDPRLSEDPEKNPGDPTQLGAEVARASGAWAVDVAKAGAAIDKGSGQPGSHAIFAWKQKDGGGAFDSKARYAFSYDLSAASEAAARVNLDAEAEALYKEGISKGWAVIFAGKATYKGSKADDGTVFAKIPTEVSFTLGLTSSASYVNCANPDLPVGTDGEFPRGMQVLPNQAQVAQITFHTDHLFWNALNVEGTPLHFDPIAAQASTYGEAGKPGVVSMEDLAQVDFTAFTTRGGEPLPARSLVLDFTAPSGQLGYQSNGAGPFNKNNFAAYLSFSALGGGHFNADGECEVLAKLAGLGLPSAPCLSRWPRSSRMCRSSRAS